MKILRLIRAHSTHEVLYDDTDETLVAAQKWWVVPVGRRFYAYTRINGKTVYMHRLILGLTPCGRGHQDVDHASGNGLDNRRCNIRIATRSQNNTNLPGRGGISGYKGVFAYGQTGKKWEACIGVEGRKVQLGVFLSKEEAAAAYDRAARSIYGEFAFTNADRQSA